MLTLILPFCGCLNILGATGFTWCFAGLCALLRGWRQYAESNNDGITWHQHQSLTCIIIICDKTVTPSKKQSGFLKKKKREKSIKLSASQSTLYLDASVIPKVLGGYPPYSSTFQWWHFGLQYLKGLSCCELTNNKYATIMKLITGFASRLTMGVYQKSKFP